MLYLKSSEQSKDLNRCSHNKEYENHKKLFNLQLT